MSEVSGPSLTVVLWTVGTLVLALVAMVAHAWLVGGVSRDAFARTESADVAEVVDRVAPMVATFRGSQRVVPRLLLRFGHREVDGGSEVEK
jgi:hypothetical protein